MTAPFRLPLPVVLVLALIAGAPATAQQDQPANAVLLIARPRLSDPNFRQTVVLVTQTPDYSTVGVILNRPSEVKLEEFLPDLPPSPPAIEREPVFFGGPVMRETLVAVFSSPETPSATAFHVLPNLYLSMHPENIRPLIGQSARRYRLYAGFAGWAPRQLESELARDDWYVLPADAETVFRRDTEQIWPDLVRRAEMRPVASPK